MGRRFVYSGFQFVGGTRLLDAVVAVAAKQILLAQLDLAFGHIGRRICGRRLDGNASEKSVRPSPALLDA